MNPPKCDDLDDIHFLMAAQKVFTCTEAARCQPEGQHFPAHDAFTRLLRRQPLDTEALWQEAKAFVEPRGGFWCWATPLWTSLMLSRWNWRPSTGVANTKGWSRALPC
jgi:hypothetical protein